jgi:hypothetical protein
VYPVGADISHLSRFELSFCLIYFYRSEAEEFISLSILTGKVSLTDASAVHKSSSGSEIHFWPAA